MEYRKVAVHVNRDKREQISRDNFGYKFSNVHTKVPKSCKSSKYTSPPRVFWDARAIASRKKDKTFDICEDIDVNF